MIFRFSVSTFIYVFCVSVKNHMSLVQTPTNARTHKCSQGRLAKPSVRLRLQLVLQAMVQKGHSWRWKPRRTCGYSKCNQIIYNKAFGVYIQNMYIYNHIQYSHIHNIYISIYVKCILSTYVYIYTLIHTSIILYTYHTWIIVELQESTLHMIKDGRNLDRRHRRHSDPVGIYITRYSKDIYHH